MIKFIYSEKASKFCEISTLFLTIVHTVKIKVEILQNFVAFSEYMDFIWLDLVLKVKYSEILIFKAIFPCRKSAETLQKKFSLKNTKTGYKLLLVSYYDT